MVLLDFIYNEFETPLFVIPFPNLFDGNKSMCYTTTKICTKSSYLKDKWYVLKQYKVGPWSQNNRNSLFILPK